MTIKETLENFKEIQVLTLNFIEKEDEIEENFQNLKSKIDKQKICDNLYSFTLFLHLIAKISDNHFHETDFYSKIEKILLSFKDEIKGKYPDSEIFSIFKNNKKILLFLLEEKILEINNYIATKIQSGKYKKEKYPQYFFPEIKPYPVFSSPCRIAEK